jgi:hypothetical protein
MIGKGKPIGNILRAAEARARDLLKNQGITKPNAAEIQRVMTVTPLEAQQIRTAISELSFSPQFISTVGDKNLNDLSQAINVSFVDAEGILLNKMLRARAQPPSFIGPKENLDDLQKGLRYYQRARAYYSAGMERFKDTVVTGFVKNANAAPGNVLDVKGILDHVIKPGKPEKLSTFLKAIKGIRTGKQQPFDTPPQTVRFGKEDLSIPDAKAKLSQLESAGLDTTILKQGIREAEETVAGRMAFGIASGTGGEMVRKQLAGEYISRLLDDPNIINLKNGALLHK